MSKVILILVLFICPMKALYAQDYLSYVRKFADTLLTYGTDKYGSKQLPMWAGLIDTRDYSVPRGTAEEAERTKGGGGYMDVFDRRAVGGANIYHDFETLKVFEILSLITRDSKYSKATKDYVTAFLNNTQNEYTGLLGWGEHMYYDFYKDEVTVGGMDPANPDYTHELLPKKPIWEELWKVSPERTAKAIEGLKYHFDGPNTQTFIFNRHANWHKINKTILGAEGLEQYQYDWKASFIAHAGLFTYSFMFLHSKTNDPRWLKWSNGVGNLHWTYRNKTTNLTSWNLTSYGQPEPQFGQTTHFAYRLYQAYELKPTEKEMRNHALILFKAAEKYAWQSKDKFYVNELNMDGSLVKPDDPRYNKPVLFRGDQVKTLPVKPQFRAPIGRVAAYLYQREKDPHFLVIAKRMVDIMKRDTLKKNFQAREVGDRIHFLMDVYDLTKEKSLLNLAKDYANKGIAGLWRNGLFARRVNEPYYESLGGVGNFVGGLLRLHLEGESKGGVNNIDWSY
ncbi:MAG TPA: hypothetical protein VK498_07590 [Ferruginibacter sp.]|nr:hypothetical protein [Ferruginibacter sp.]